jgi:A/G-specific adenine glycosylase
MNKKQFQENLLTWYDNNKRILPWRDNPDPYRVWISEIMLQQTKVSTVIPYFNRFTETVKNVEELATIPEDELLKLWEGLGYYSRARNLQKAAKQIQKQHNGIIPSNIEELEKLSGIGNYTSGAIASIAFNQRYTAVDGNVLRVFARLLNIQEDIKQREIKAGIKEQVKALLPKERVGDFNQALMEIGATVCLPSGAPYCELCPLKDQCKAYEHQTQNLIPLKRKKKETPTMDITVLLIKYNNEYVIEQRPNTGLLASMYQFPYVEEHITMNDIKHLQIGNIKQIKKLPNSKHIFSHLKWNMVAFEIELQNKTKANFVSKEDILNKYSIPTAFKTYKEIIRGESDEQAT